MFVEASPSVPHGELIACIRFCLVVSFAGSVAALLPQSRKTAASLRRVKAFCKLAERFKGYNFLNLQLCSKEAASFQKLLCLSG